LLYAEYTFILKWSNSLQNLIKDMQKSLEAINKWLRDSGLKVKQGKTEICLFSKPNIALVRIMFNRTTIETKNQYKGLVMCFTPT
jgi:hypothetical protein